MGFCCIIISGKGVNSLIHTEPGGHRWQGKSGNKIHTSTITVAVLAVQHHVGIDLSKKDLRIETYKAGGTGGQHRNKTDSAVRITHVPTGLVTRCESERSQHVNKERALLALHSKITELMRSKKITDEQSTRKSQLGCGARGDKRRTIREQDGIVTDHVIGAKFSLKKYLKGNLSWLR